MCRNCIVENVRSCWSWHNYATDWRTHTYQNWVMKWWVKILFPQIPRRVRVLWSNKINTISLYLLKQRRIKIGSKEISTKVIRCLDVKQINYKGLGGSNFALSVYLWIQLFSIDAIAVGTVMLHTIAHSTLQTHGLALHVHLWSTGPRLGPWSRTPT